MLNIENKDRFGKVIAGALATVEVTAKSNQTKKRWINAISKAAAQIDERGEFMDYDATENHMVIWSQDSNAVYSANGVCQCRAFERGLPCWLRAAARIACLYLELPVKEAPNFPNEQKTLAEKLKARNAETIIHSFDGAPMLPDTKEPVRVEKYGSVRVPVYA